MGHTDVNARSTFMYFGYGSNLLAKRIHIQNASAVRRNIGVLKGYHLDFYKPAQRESTESTWNGSSATIIDDDDENAQVWGTIWEIDLTHMADLDRQEGVLNDIYIPLIKEIITPDGEKIECRLYQMMTRPSDSIDLSDPNIPYDRQPSKTYLDTIINGAVESKLPEAYIHFLKSVTHNGKLASADMLAKLEV